MDNTSKKNDKTNEIKGGWGEGYSAEELAEDEANGLGSEYEFDGSVEEPPHPFWAKINSSKNYNNSPNSIDVDSFESTAGSKDVDSQFGEKQFDITKLIVDENFLYDIKIITGKNDRVIYPCRNKDGFFSVSLSGDSRDYRPFTLNQLIEAFVRGDFSHRGAIRMKAKGESGNGNGRSPTSPNLPATVEITENLRNMSRNEKSPSTIIKNIQNNTNGDITLSLNTILYGPPGTGKTFSTFERAVLICDGKLPEGGGVSAIIARYEELRRDGRIAFVTFHQSYGYEEFVEGLRPRASNGVVTYEVTRGVFRLACDAAKRQKMVKPGLTGKSLNQRTIFKMSLGASWNNEGVKVFQYGLENGCVLLGWGDDIDFTECPNENAIKELVQRESPKSEKVDSHARYINYFKHELKVGDIIIVSNGNLSFRAIAEVTGDYQYVEDAPFHQMRPVKWLAVYEVAKPTSEIFHKSFAMSSLYKLNADGVNYQRIEELISGEAAEQVPKPHLMIIDEINRANISKVFGELITLLEPDKREGGKFPLTVKLPYSGDDFIVPGNLHIIATMNTADRSIALLDTALRRRFDFEELMPNPDILRGVLIEGINIEKLLTAINERVEILYDRDHTIGHAFFIGAQTLDQLESIFRLKVLPLLKEYFYENWSNVRRVLNDLGDGEFVRRIKHSPIPADGEDSYLDEPRTIYRVNTNKFSVAAYKRIYGET